jgi:hypothetical protein
MSSIVRGAGTRALGLLAATAVALAAAVAAGIATGSVVWHGRPSDDTDAWSDLGHGLLALAAGGAVGGLVYVVGVVVGVRWAVPRGRRLVTATTILAVSGAVPIVGGSALRWAERGGMPLLGALVGLAVLAAAGALVGVVVGAVEGGTAARIGLGAAAGFLAVSVAGNWRAPAVADDARADRYERSGAPLALVDGRDVSPPVPGWELESVDGGWMVGDVTVTYDAPAVDGRAPSRWVVLVLSSDREALPCEGAPAGGTACAVLGHRDGEEIMGDPITGVDGVTGYSTVWVDVPGGRWSIRGTDVPQPVDEAAARAILTALEPVDADTFTGAT